MIKLLHTADWHLGKMFFGRSMLEDQKYFFDNYFFPTLERLGFGRNDCVVVAGDIFDRAVPPVAAVELLDEVLTRVSEMGIKLMAITGNHDGAQRMSMGARLMRAAGVYLYTSPADIRDTLVLDDGAGTRAVLHPLPHFDITEGKALLGDDSVSGYSNVFNDIVSLSDRSDKNALHIIVAHCTVLGEQSSRVDEQTDEPRSVGGSDAVAPSVFDPFDLTLLGHFHRDIGFSELSGYSGSPLGYSFDSAGTVRSMRYYELNGKDVSLTRIPIDRPLHPLVKLSGSFEQLLSDETPASDAFIYAMLSDTSLIFEPMFRLRPKFPNILGLGYSSVGTGSFSSDYRERLRSSLRSRSVGDEEVFTSFMTQMCGFEPTGEELSFFEKLCRSVDSMED